MKKKVLLDKVWLLKAENRSLQVKRADLKSAEKKICLLFKTKSETKWKCFSLLTLDVLESLLWFFWTSQSCAIKVPWTLSRLQQSFCVDGFVEVLSSRVRLWMRYQGSFTPSTKAKNDIRSQIPHTLIWDKACAYGSGHYVNVLQHDTRNSTTSLIVPSITALELGYSQYKDQCYWSELNVIQ